ncbi:ABC transporter ATP-binding protein [Eisenbergiella sp.]
MLKHNKLKPVGIAIRLMWNMDKWLLLHSIITSVIEAATPFAGILLSAYILDGLQAGTDFSEIITVSLTVVAVIFLLTVLKAYFTKILNVHIGMCGKKYDTLMSMKTISMDYPLLDSPAVNDIRVRIRHDNDWGAGFYSLVWQLPYLLNSLISALVSIALMLPLFMEGHFFSDTPAILLLLSLGAIIAFNLWFTSVKNKELYRLLDDPTLDKSYLGYFLWKDQDYHYGKDIRIYEAKSLIKSKLDGDLMIKKQWIKQLVNNNMKSGFFSNLSAGALLIISYIFVALRAAAGALTAGAVVKYAGIIYRFTQAVTNVFNALDEYAVSSNRQLSTLEYLNVKDVLKKGTLPVEKRAFCDGSDNEYEIEFRDVSFKYPGSDTYALRHVSLKFRVGERLAVVGMNGSGKTTFIKLLCHLYDPTEGEILLNGIDIRKYDYEEYMKIFSVVFQDFKLFSFSLGQNVAADMDYDAKRVEACLDAAGFNNRRSSMPEGLKTCLYKDFEENGVEISGGEAQKIALARALYKDAPFIVLDEPTAALDPIAESEIYAKFNEIVGNRTAIYISHRLSSCRFCDEIAVFDNGQIVQLGSHEELAAAAGGKYHELWNAQAQYYSS